MLMKSLEVLLALAVCAAVVSSSDMSSGDVDVDHLDGFSPDVLDKITDNYIVKTEKAQMLRKELHDHLNLLSHLNTMTDKFMFFAVLGQVRRTFLELDEMLDSFVPSVADAHEVVHNFKIFSSQSAAAGSAGGEQSSEEQEQQPRLLKKRFDWFKRNYNPYGSNLYSKIPVIRTGK